MFANAFSLGVLDMRCVYELSLYWALSSPFSLPLQVLQMMNFFLSFMMRGIRYKLQELVERRRIDHLTIIFF